MDGLRSVAVYLVIAFHAGIGRFSGGFIGVDLFFVLSGFLVTSVMLTEYGARGRIDLVRFYARRIRRLLPAAVVAIIAIAVVSLLFDPPLTRSGQLGAARSALLYVSNWYFIGDKTDYFAVGIDVNPYLHFWSLSVEEQFYVAFPLVLMGILAVSRGRRATATALLLVVTAALVAMQLWWAERDQVRAYYGTDARVYQMAVGALLAVALTTPVARRAISGTMTRSASRLIAVVSIVLLGATATNVIDVTPSTRGLLAAMLAITLIAALEFAGGPVEWMLARPTLVQLGRVSYGTYLWHWPIIVYTQQVLELGALAMAVLAAVGATAMAFMSYNVLEMPIRTSSRLARRSHQVVVVGLLASVAAALVVVPPILNSDRLPVVIALGRPGIAAVDGAANAEVEGTPEGVGSEGGAVVPSSPPVAETVPPDLDLEAAAGVATGMFGCVDGEPDDCILERGGGPHIFVLGDSNAAMYMPMFRQLAQDHDLTLSATTAPGCTWQQGLGWAVEDQNLVEECVGTRDDAYERVLPALAPDLVIGVHIPRDDPARGVGSPFLAIDDSLGSGADAMAAATRSSLDRLEGQGARVLIIEPVPYTTFDPVRCLSGTTLVTDCAFAATPEPTPTEMLYRSESDSRAGVFAVDVDPLVCPGKPLCLPILDGELVYRDAFHIYPPFAVDHRSEFWDLIVATGAIT